MEKKQHLVVETTCGPIRGIMQKGICVYRGIPYASPITKERRCSPPEPISCWNSILDAAKYSGIAPQRSILRKKSSEDCLSLNIYAPFPSGKLNPVLFFIHGGAFSHGAGSESFYDGTTLAANWDIVVITINYRLGVLGFFDFRELSESYSANNGVRDVILALQWVQANCIQFGGNPAQVTVMGQSAGGTMVSSLVTNSNACSYFHRAIIMSGGPTQVQSLKECQIISKAFLSFANIHTQREFEKRETDELISLQQDFIKHYGLGAATFRITVDREIIPDYPIHFMNYREKSPVNFLIGTTKEEMGFMALKPLARLIDVKTIVDAGLAFEEPEIKNQLLATYNDLYGEKRGISMMYTDLLFRISSVWFAQEASKNSNVWMYRFDYETQALKMNGFHAFHSTDIPYVFGNFNTVLVKPMFLLTPNMEEVYSVARTIQSDFIEFVKTGHLSWPQVTPHTPVATCYHKETSIHSMVDPSIYEIYTQTTYYKKAFAGLSVYD